MCKRGCNEVWSCGEGSLSLRSPKQKQEFFDGFEGLVNLKPHCVSSEFFRLMCFHASKWVSWSIRVLKLGGVFCHFSRLVLDYKRLYMKWGFNSLSKLMYTTSSHSGILNSSLLKSLAVLPLNTARLPSVGSCSRIPHWQKGLVITGQISCSYHSPRSSSCSSYIPNTSCRLNLILSPYRYSKTLFLSPFSPFPEGGKKKTVALLPLRPTTMMEAAMIMPIATFCFFTYSCFSNDKKRSDWRNRCVPPFLQSGRSGFSPRWSRLLKGGLVGACVIGSAIVLVLLLKAVLLGYVFFSLDRCRY